MGYPTALTPQLLIAKGDIDGHYYVQKFGTNHAVGTSFVAVSDGGIYRTPQSTGAIALRIKAGGDVADDVGGSGAWETTIYGLDDAFIPASEAVANNGASVSLATTTLFTRVHRTRVTGSGVYASISQGSHVGSIVIEDTAGDEWADIPINGFPHSTTEIAAASIGVGEVAYIHRLNNFTDSTKITELLFFAREGLGELAPPYSPMRVLADFRLKGGAGTRDFSDAPIKVIGPADIGFMTKVDVGTASVSAGFEMLVIRE